MSQNRELEFIEPEPGKWYYLLEDYFAPKNSWDWREHARCYGPFPSQAAAEYHQYDQSGISTPGSTISAYGEFAMTDVLRNLVANATLERAV